MGGCGCIYVGDFDEAQFCNQKNQTARKSHKCGECARVIQAGEIYEYSTQLFEGDFSVYKTCADCLGLRNAFFCEGWWWGELWRLVEQHLNEGVELEVCCLDQLTSRARDRVIDLIDECTEKEL